MTKKQKVVFAVVAVVIVLGMIMSYAFLMKNLHIDSTPEEKKMPAMSDTEDYEVRESDESIQSSETEEDYYMTSTGVTAEEQFAEEIKNDVLKHDWDALSEKISYPIAINGTTDNNREDFIKAIEMAPSIKPFRHTYLHEESYRELAKKIVLEDEVLQKVLV